MIDPYILYLSKLFRRRAPAGLLKCGALLDGVQNRYNPHSNVFFFSNPLSTAMLNFKGFLAIRQTVSINETFNLFC